ncbi:unnamed protein product [Rhizopus microsporus]
MSERGGRGQYSNRGGDKGGRGGGRGGSRGGRGGYHNASQEKPKKESILDLIVGTLMGYDPLLNLVLDHTVEYQRDLETGYVTENTRELGLSVLRGTAIILISPFDGMEEIENPFAQ